MTDRKVRVRFAPSPTGPLHIGGVRTALFNYLFAKKHNGDFILRIEDTDSTRFVEGAEEYVNESLNWLRLVPDEGVVQGGNFGPYKQSERREIYKKYAQQLIDSGWAYYAFDTPQQLDVIREQYEAEKKTFAYDIHNRMQMSNSLTLSKEEVEKKINSGDNYVVRFKMPENVEVKATDLIRGEVVFNTNTLDDKVLFKSVDQLPTYHLANIVDDHLMEISHVIRGEEWLPSLPLHVMMYRAFDWEDTRPEFAHLPLILKPNGKGKLSKRDGDKEGFPVFPLEYVSPDGETANGYREAGYFPEAVNNLLALLGWNSGTEQEVFTIEELTNLFSLERVNKSGARFDPDKAKWFNHQYLIQKDDKEIAEVFIKTVEKKGYNTNIEELAKYVALAKERVNFIDELWGQLSFFFEAPTSYDEKVVSKRWKDKVPAFIAEIPTLLANCNNWVADEIKDIVVSELQAQELNMGAVMNALRLSMVGGAFGPDLFTIIELIGKEETFARIKKAVETLEG